MQLRMPLSGGGAPYLLCTKSVASLTLLLTHADAWTYMLAAQVIYLLIATAIILLMSNTLSHDRLLRRIVIATIYQCVAFCFMYVIVAMLMSSYWCGDGDGEYARVIRAFSTTAPCIPE